MKTPRLGAIGSNRAVKPIVATLGSEHAQIRQHAARALGQIGDREAATALIELLADKDSMVRLAAAQALGTIKDHRAVEPLSSRLDDESTNVRAVAAQALGDIEGRQAVEPLIGALDDENDLVIMIAAESLAKITGKELGHDAAAEAVLEAYRQGTVSAFGYLRHTPTTADAVPGKHVWEHLDSVGQGAYGTYQNGGYWPQPVGFYAFAIAQIDRQAAAQLARELIDHTRLLAEHGAPYEWLSPSITLAQTPGLCRWLGASAALPLEGFRRLSTECDTGQSPH